MLVTSTTSGGTRFVVPGPNVPGATDNGVRGGDAAAPGARRVSVPCRRRGIRRPAPERGGRRRHARPGAGGTRQVLQAEGPERIGPYTVVKRLGVGGMGVV